MLRKNRASCNSNKILHAFLRGGKKRKSEAVGYLLTRAGEGREEGRGGDKLEIEYFDEVGLREFLHTRADITDGMLQRFAPRTPLPGLKVTRHSFIDSPDEHCTVFHCTWAPRIWLCDKRINRLRVDDRKRSLLARCVT